MRADELNGRPRMTLVQEVHAQHLQRPSRLIQRID